MRNAIAGLLLLLPLAAWLCAADLEIHLSAPADVETQWTETAVRLSYTTLEADPGHDALRISIRLPHPPRWVWLDGDPLTAAQYSIEPDGILQVALPPGSHVLRAGWGDQPVALDRRVTVPITVEGRSVGELVGVLRAEGLQAFAALDVGAVGLYTVRLTTSPDVGRETVGFAVGDSSIERWYAAAGTLVSPRAVPGGGRMALRLSVDGERIDPMSVRAVHLIRTAPAAVAQPADEPPSGAILVEAEDFARGSTSGYQVSRGSPHSDMHGGSCVFSFLGDGSWLEWDIEVPADGEYDLYARIASAETFAYRDLTVDAARGRRRALVAFPGTGGWGHSADTWGLRRITGVEGMEPLQLRAGKRTLRMTGVLLNHLNVDYLLLVPRGQAAAGR